jgi:hypothetical protein
MPNSSSELAAFAEEKANRNSTRRGGADVSRGWGTGKGVSQSSRAKSDHSIIPKTTKQTPDERNLLVLIACSKFTIVELGFINQLCMFKRVESEKPTHDGVHYHRPQSECCRSNFV